MFNISFFVVSILFFLAAVSNQRDKLKRFCISVMLRILFLNSFVISFFFFFARECSGVRRFSVTLV